MVSMPVLRQATFALALLRRCLRMVSTLFGPCVDVALTLYRFRLCATLIRPGFDFCVDLGRRCFKVRRFNMELDR